MNSDTTPNTIGGTLDGAYIPHSSKDHLVVTRHNHDVDAGTEVYSWRHGHWLYDKLATNNRIHNMTTRREDEREALRQELDEAHAKIYRLEAELWTVREDVENLERELADA